MAKHPGFAYEVQVRVHTRDDAQWPLAEWHTVVQCVNENDIKRAFDEHCKAYPEQHLRVVLVTSEHVAALTTRIAVASMPARLFTRLRDLVKGWREDAQGSVIPERAVGWNQCADELADVLADWDV